jgi:hypothetical protein
VQYGRHAPFDVSCPVEAGRFFGFIRGSFGKLSSCCGAFRLTVYFPVRPESRF